MSFEGPPDARDSNDRERLHALIADDESNQRYLLRSTLEALGFVVDESSDGVELCERFRLARARGTELTVVVTDVRMPRRSGLDALAAIRSESPVPAIVVTGDPDRARRRVAALGGAALVGKPYRHTDMLEALCAIGFTFAGGLTVSPIGDGARASRQPSEDAPYLGDPARFGAP